MTKREPKFAVNQFIEWSSQAGGVWLTKTGRIIAIMPLNSTIRMTLEQLGYDPERCSIQAQQSALVDRYLVDAGKKHPNGKKKIYAPDFARAESRGKVLTEDLLKSAAL